MDLSPHNILYSLLLITEPLGFSGMPGHQLEASSPNLSRSHDAKRCSQKHASGSTEDNFQDLPGGAVSLYIPSPSIWDLIQV